MKKNIGFWKTLWRTLHIWWSKCPKCNGWMYADMLDMEFDKLVSKCEDCGERLI